MTRVLNKLFKVLVVELVKTAFVSNLLFANLILAHKVQSIAVHFVVSVLAVELQIIQVNAANQVISHSITTIALVLTLLGDLVPETHASSVLPAQDLHNAIVEIGHVVALGVPARDDVSVFNQAEKDVQQLRLGVTQQGVFKLFRDSLSLLLSQGPGSDHQGKVLAQPAAIHAHSRDLVECLFGRTESQLRVEVRFDVKVSYVQFGAGSVLVVVIEAAEDGIDVRLKLLFSGDHAALALEFFSTSGLKLLQPVTKDALVLATLAGIIHDISAGIAVVYTLSVDTLYNFNCVLFFYEYCVHVCQIDFSSFNS